MRRQLLRLRPYVIAAAVGTILVIDLSNQWEVPVTQLPEEFHERYLGRIKADDEAAALKAAADAGVAQAQYAYALRHTSYAPAKLIIRQDRDVSFRYMKLAAEKRHPRAMAILSLYYLKGLGVEKNAAEASAWARRAIEKGQPMGYRVLGEIGLEEAKRLPVTKDDKKQRAEVAEAIRKAHEDLQHGADLGDRGSLRLLGTEHDAGAPDMPKSYLKAVEYYRKAALKRDADSIRLLSDRYEAGEKAPRDLKQAYAWTMVAIEVEDREEDRQRLANLGAMMRIEDEIAGQELGAQLIKDLTSESADALARLNPGR
jgi:TPR repeat protein